MTLTVKHASLTGAAANPSVLVDGPKWDADHTITGGAPADVGLGNVDNTSDATKNAATATLTNKTLTNPVINGGTGTGIRERLTANRTYYVLTTGSNSNNGLANTSGGAFLTLQYAFDLIADTLDFCGFIVTIQLGNGAYTAGLTTSKALVGADGPAALKILGSATPSNVTITVTGGDCFKIGRDLNGSTQLTLGGVKLSTVTSGNCINISGGGVAVTVGTAGFPVEFGAAAQNHMTTNHSAWLIAGTNNLVSGNATIHAASLSNSVLALHITTETFSNSPVFTYYAFADTNSSLYLTSMTFTNGGTVTGTRFFVSGNAIIYTLASLTYLPGNAAGVELSGGRYISNTGASGIPVFASGVQTYATAPTGAIVGTTDTQTLTNKTFGDSVVAPVATTTAAQIDVGGQSVITVTNGSNALITASQSTYYVCFIVETTQSGQAAGYFLRGGGAVSDMFLAGGWVSSTTTPAAGKMSVAWSGTQFRVYNNVGGTATFKVFLVKMS